MTIALLTLLVLIELARLALQYRSGKTYAERQEKTYCEAYEVSNIYCEIFEDQIRNKIDLWASFGYEIASTVYIGYDKILQQRRYILFFTRKKIKNFIEQ